MTELAAHEDQMLIRLEQGLTDVPGVTLYGAPDRRRTPTVLFTVADVPNAVVYAKLAQDNVNAPAGTFYAVDCARRLGLDETGAVRAGIAAYTDESDVDRLVAGVERITKGD
jgi:selenocysteine lyase/cysteine desulfurase